MLVGGQGGKLRIAAVLGCVVGLCVPVLAGLAAALLRCLIAAQLQASASEIPAASRFLPDVQSWLPENLSTLGEFSYLLGGTMLVVLITAGLLFFFYRQIQIAAVSFEVSLILRLKEHAKALATTRTLSAQRTALTDCLDYHLPRVRACLARWWRAFPRHVVQLAGCSLFMLLVQPMLSVLTIVATALVVVTFRFFDRRRRTALPVVRERAAQQRNELIELCLQGPLLNSIHDEKEIGLRFTEQLDHYRRDAVRSLTSSVWKTPIVLVASCVIVGVFLFLIAVQILQSDASFSVPGAFAFTLCFLGAVVSATRLQRSAQDLSSITAAADALDQFLTLQVEEYDSEQLKSIGQVKKQVALDHVTVQDSAGRKLLENVCVSFKPGLLIGVVANQPLQARALVELLMGFGRPIGGRLLFDDDLVSDLKPESVSRASHWVSNNGSLVTGTLQENILRGSQETSLVGEAIAAAKLDETVQQLPDALHTLITPDDDRLRGDAAFRIGVARALVAKASIAVVEEPARSFDNEAESQTLTAIRSLVRHDSITVVLPQRLLTLRSCDAVIMLNEHQVTDVGTHAELLQRNEYYRHLNYLRFNPFQAVG